MSSGPSGGMSSDAAQLSHRKAVSWTVWLLAVGAAIALWLVIGEGGVQLWGQLRAFYHEAIPLDLRLQLWQARHAAVACLSKFVRSIYLTPWSYAIVLGVFLLERLIPAKPHQKVCSIGMVQDFLWFNLDALFRMSWLAAYLALLKVFYERYLGVLTIDAVTAWSPAARFLLSFVVFDFLNWLHHVIRHHVQALWYFHMVHHSQRELNVFTDARVHLVEYVVAKTVIFIPMYMFHVNVSTIFWMTLAMEWYTRIYHANLRTNYGLLKYVLVTPQSHRIHHSIEAKHQNKNLGLFLTVWDRLFGTLYPNYEEYPETGVEDDAFPLEDMVVGLSVFTTYGRQLLYPFQLMAKRRAA